MTTNSPSLHAKAIHSAVCQLIHGLTPPERDWLLGKLLKAERERGEVVRSPLGRGVMEVLNYSSPVPLRSRDIMEDLARRNLRPSKEQLHDCLAWLRRKRLVETAGTGNYRVTTRLRPVVPVPSVGPAGGPHEQSPTADRGDPG